MKKLRHHKLVLSSVYKDKDLARIILGRNSPASLLDTNNVVKVINYYRRHYLPSTETLTTLELFASGSLTHPYLIEHGLAPVAVNMLGLDRHQFTDSINLITGDVLTHRLATKANIIYSLANSICYLTDNDNVGFPDFSTLVDALHTCSVNLVKKGGVVIRVPTLNTVNLGVSRNHVPLDPFDPILKAWVLPVADYTLSYSVKTTLDYHTNVITINYSDVVITNKGEVKVEFVIGDYPVKLRLWTYVEITEALYLAGFKRVHFLDTKPEIIDISDNSEVTNAISLKTPQYLLAIRS